MEKAFEKIVGHIGKDLDITKVTDILKFETETILNRSSTDKTKQIIVEISVKEVKDVV